MTNTDCYKSADLKSEYNMKFSSISWFTQQSFVFSLPQYVDL